MRCQASSSSEAISWILNSDEQEQLIYSSKTNITDNFTRFSVNTNRKGMVILQTNSSELRDAGVYECKTTKKDNHDSATIVKTSAHAVILGTFFRTGYSEIKYDKAIAQCYNVYHLL